MFQHFQTKTVEKAVEKVENHENFRGFQHWLILLKNILKDKNMYIR
jgi:hypothetical protein